MLSCVSLDRSMTASATTSSLTLDCSCGSLSSGHMCVRVTLRGGIRYKGFGVVRNEEEVMSNNSLYCVVTLVHRLGTLVICLLTLDSSDTCLCLLSSLLTLDSSDTCLLSSLLPIDSCPFLNNEETVRKFLYQREEAKNTKQLTHNEAYCSLSRINRLQLTMIQYSIILRSTTKYPLL